MGMISQEKLSRTSGRQKGLLVMASAIVFNKKTNALEALILLKYVMNWEIKKTRLGT